VGRWGYGLLVGLVTTHVLVGWYRWNVSMGLVGSDRDGLGGESDLVEFGPNVCGLFRSVFRLEVHLRHQYAISMQSVCNRYATSMQSVCTQCALSVHPVTIKGSSM
jgi:hypothetical protein